MEEIRHTQLILIVALVVHYRKGRTREEVHPATTQTEVIGCLTLSNRSLDMEGTIE